MKSFSVYYAIDRETGEYACMGIGSRGKASALKAQMYADAKDPKIASKYKGGAVYNDYGLVSTRSFAKPAEEPKKEAPKKTRKKVSEE